MKLDDSSRGTSPRHFEEENPDFRRREKKNMHGTQTCKTSNKFEKNTDFKPDKSRENK